MLVLVLVVVVLLLCDVEVVFVDILDIAVSVVGANMVGVVGVVVLCAANVIICVYVGCGVLEHDNNNTINTTISNNNKQQHDQQYTQQQQQQRQCRK